MNRKSQSVGELDINDLLYTALQKRLTSLEKQLLYTRVLFFDNFFSFPKSAIYLFSLSILNLIFTPNKVTPTSPSVSIIFLLRFFCSFEYFSIKARNTEITNSLNRNVFTSVIYFIRNFHSCYLTM